MCSQMFNLSILLFLLGAGQVYSASAQPSPKSGIVTWEEVKELRDNTTVLLIEVRQPIELQQTGVIPGSINIPLDILEDTLRNLSPEEFFQRYQREKPTFETIIVFTCRSGSRSAQAQRIALNLGFVNSKNYSGGWLEWEARLNELK